MTSADGETEQESAGKTRVLYFGLCVLMLALGVSDTAKGVLAPLYKKHFDLDETGVAAIITAGYVGNFLFLLVGGKCMDHFRARTAQLLFWTIWMGSLLLMAATDDFFCLLLGTAGALGASALLNTSMGLIVPAMGVRHSVFMVSFLFFVQGIGTSIGQSVLGNQVRTFDDWQLTLRILMCVGLTGGVSVLTGRYPHVVQSKHGNACLEWNDRRIGIMIGIFGLYFIAEHGILN